MYSTSSSIFFSIILLSSIIIFQIAFGNDITNVVDDGMMVENFIEGYVKDFFNKELDSSKQQNLTDCMTRLLCENICQRTIKGEIKGEPIINSVEMLGTNSKEPMGYFFAGGDNGYELGKNKQCYKCASKYSNCPSNQYDHHRELSNRYEKNMIKTAETSIDNFYDVNGSDNSNDDDPLSSIKLD